MIPSMIRLRFAFLFFTFITGAVAADNSRTPVTREVGGIVADRAELNGTLARVNRLPARVAFQLRRLGTKRWGRITAWERLERFQDSVSFSAIASNLTWNTEYEVRAIAIIGGALRPGNIIQFHSSFGDPQIVALAHTGITSSNAVLRATVYPNQSTMTWFEWGTSTNYGNVSSIVHLPASTAAQQVALPLDGLLSDTTTYHWRLIASNLSGLVMSSDAAFIPTDYVGIPEGHSWTIVSEIPFVGKIFAQAQTQRAGAEFAFLPGSFASGSALLCEMLPVNDTPMPGASTTVSAPASGGSVSIFAWPGWSDYGSIRFTAQTGSVVLTNLSMTYEWGNGLVGDRNLFTTNIDLRLHH